MDVPYASSPLLARFFLFVVRGGGCFGPERCGFSRPLPATVADDYADLTWPNLVRTLVRFNAINIADPVIIDEYAIITECDLYKAFYHDDFKWNQVRKAVHESIKMNVSTYPVNYRYSVTIQLGRYDFTAKLFRFNKLTKMTNVNTFKMFAVNNRSCGADNVKSLPHNFRVVLTEPIFLEGLPLSEKDFRDDAPANGRRRKHQPPSLHALQFTHCLYRSSAQASRGNGARGDDALFAT